MNSHDARRPSPSGLAYAAVGIILFVVGGRMLADALGGARDVLWSPGLLFLASGLVGIIAGGVALGSSRST